MSRGGVNLNRSTLYNWMAAVADVTKPLYERMKQLLLQSKIIQTDDTSVKLIDPLAEAVREQLASGLTSRTRIIRLRCMTSPCRVNDMVPKNFSATIPATYKPIPSAHGSTPVRGGSAFRPSPSQST